MSATTRGPQCDAKDQYQYLRPYPGGRVFTCSLGGRPVSMLPSDCIRQRARSKGIYYSRVLIGRRGGKPVIFEYDENGKPVDKLTCAPKARRNYYQVKNTLFLVERDKRLAERLYPQLKQFWDSKLMKFLTSDFVAGPSQFYKIGYVIVKIEPSKSYPGSGMVWLQAVLHLGKSVIILEEPQGKPLRWLNDDFIWFSHHAAFMQMAAFTTTVIAETLGSVIDTVFKKSEVIQTEAGKYLSARITKLFTTDAINSLGTAVALAVADIQEQKANNVSKALPNHLVAQLKQIFLNEVKGAVTSLAKAG
jgi:hypothetical protein